MKKLRDLLSRGYFPRELPPVFNTTAMRRVTRIGAPNTFWNPQRMSLHCHHTVPRSGSLRRLLAIPNPITYANLCAEIDGGWREISKHVANSRISKSKPRFFTAGARAVLPEIPNQSDLIPFRAHARAAGKTMVRTDISRFYNSIYTHSVPWALHTKPIAKRRKRDYSLLGNRIDRALRNLQDGQTMGVPIGPDASLVISEIILAAIDVAYETSRNVVGLRYIDDYELIFSSTSEAEDGLATLEHVESEFGLELNPKKTMIEQLPMPHEFPWVTEIRSLPIRGKRGPQARDVLRIFDRAFEYARQNPDEHVLRYTVARLKNVTWEESNWQFFQHLLLQEVLAEPATLITALGCLMKGQTAGQELEEDLIAEVLNKLIIQHAVLGHGSETIWSLWGLLALKLPIDSRAVQALENSTDCAVVLMTLHAKELGLVPLDFDTTLWESLMTTDELYGSSWLVAYEASIKGWLPSAGRKDHIASDPNFRWMRDLGISFYDDSKIRPLKLTGVAPSVGVAPMFSPL